MGEVYEAEDRELKERVAIKVIRADAAEDERSMERFRREIQLARRVTHPNVCRVFDVFLHRVTSARGDLVTAILSMELLEGEPLSDRLRRTGRMSVATALPIVRQIASALDAAHDIGIVHRDFKSPNVMLVPSGKNDAQRDRAVVTDFGLARRHMEGEGTASSLTSSGELVGSPAYMAPEQLEGATITPAADVYAFGVVLYEMVAGVLPFTGDTPLAVALKRLHEVPDPPRSRAPNLPVTWNDAILKCLDRRPENRYPTAGDAVRVLEDAAPWDSTVISAPRSPGRRLPALRGALIGLLILTGAWAAGVKVRQKRAAQIQELKADFVLAIAPFQVLSPEAKSDADLMRALLHQRLLEALQNESRVRILAPDDRPAPRTEAEAEAFGRPLFADVVVWGQALGFKGEAVIEPKVTTLIDGTEIRENGGGLFGDSHDPTMSIDPLRTTSNSGADTLAVRQAKARDVADLALILVATQFYARDQDKQLAMLRRISTPESLCQQGFALMRTATASSWLEAEALFKRALVERAQDPLPHIGLARLYRRACWTAGLRSLCSPEKGLAEYVTASELDPRAEEPALNVAEMRVQAGTMEAALPALTRSLAAYPHNAVIGSLAASIHEWVGDAALADGTLESLPGTPPTMGQAEALLGHGRYEEVSRLLRAGLVVPRWGLRTRLLAELALGDHRRVEELCERERSRSQGRRPIFANLLTGLKISIGAGTAADEDILASGAAADGGGGEQYALDAIQQVYAQSLLYRGKTVDALALKALPFPFSVDVASFIVNRDFDRAAAAASGTLNQTSAWVSEADLFPYLLSRLGSRKAEAESFRSTLIRKRGLQLSDRQLPDGFAEASRLPTNTGALFIDFLRGASTEEETWAFRPVSYWDLCRKRWTCLLAYWFGLYYLGEGNKRTAQVYFEKSVGTQMRHLIPWFLATVELEHLNKAAK